MIFIKIHRDIFLLCVELVRNYAGKKRGIFMMIEHANIRVFLCKISYLLFRFCNYQKNKLRKSTIFSIVCMYVS